MKEEQKAKTNHPHLKFLFATYCLRFCRPNEIIWSSATWMGQGNTLGILYIVRGTRSNCKKPESIILQESESEDWGELITLPQLAVYLEMWNSDLESHHH